MLHILIVEHRKSDGVRYSGVRFSDYYSSWLHQHRYLTLIELCLIKNILGFKKVKSPTSQINQL
ncbi:hypothetical protein ACTXT7_013610 [Hymenolepis weldensis]